MRRFLLGTLLSLALTSCDGGKPDDTDTAGPDGDPTPEADCGDGADDDGDGFVDCYDDDCAAETACMGEFSCDDGIDNDGNGVADCADGGCADAPGCFEADCADGADDDGDGRADCYDDDCAGETACLGEFSCDDGVDNDGNGAVDCADGACVASPACFEVDCADGADDENDGAIDCADPDCEGDAACLAACADGDLGSAVGDALATGSTVGMGDEWGTGSLCGGSSGVEDAAYLWVAPADGSYAFSTAGSSFDTILRVMADCDGTELTCDDDVDFAAGDASSRACYDAVAGEALLVVVDGFSTTGDYVLAVNPTGACVESACTDGLDEDDDGFTDCADPDCTYGADCYEAACDDGTDNDADGAADCADTDCAYAVECYEAACTDGIDDDGDGAVDCADSDCSFAYECYELDCTDGLDDELDGEVDCADTDCAYDPSCEETACADGLDDEGDGAIDCADADCAADAACIESACTDGLDDEGDGAIDCDDSDCALDAACPGACVDADLGSVVGEAVATGSNAGLDDVFAGSCVGGTGGLDYAYTWTAPADGCYTFDTSSSDYDTVLLAYDGCGGTELDCDDDSGDEVASTFGLTLSAGDTIVLVIDAYASYATGTWILDITEGC